MKRVHIVGGKNHGKTTLVVELVQEFQSRGIRVGTIKHTHHHHELDTPGKDSHRHREAGAEVVGILSRTMNAVFWPNNRDENEQAKAESESDRDSRYESFARMFADCELVLVEGDTRTAAPKLEVWRGVNKTPLMSDRLNNVRGIVSDDAPETTLTVLRRSDIVSLADFILAGQF